MFNVCCKSLESQKTSMFVPSSTSSTDLKKLEFTCRIAMRKPLGLFTVAQPEALLRHRVMPSGRLWHWDGVWVMLLDFFLDAFPPSSINTGKAVAF